MLQVGAHENQAAGAALAFGGRDAGLSAPNLFLQVVALTSLGILKLFFARLELLFQCLLAGQQLLELVLLLHSCRW